MTTPDESVDTTDDLHPWLETYPRWQWATLVFGVPAAVANTATTMPGIVISIGAACGLALAQTMLRPFLAWFVAHAPQRRS